ncbi:uncharacterized protein LOC135934462 isoform X1 [Cloeon dipterum]|uniref:uncharacterized protein LOC135934462 isoform X1 n=1 Tax=Cloeon dipterum TaxID=197152 RepID=UPI0032208F40
MESAHIVHSSHPKVHIPEVNLLDFVFESHKNFSQEELNRQWIVDVPSGKSVTFRQAKYDAQKIASGLVKLGFKKGDLLFFVTTAMAELYLFELAVWMLGGGVKGVGAVESHEHFYLHQVNEMQIKYVLTDCETYDCMKKAVDDSNCRGVKFFSCGEVAVQGTIHISNLLSEDAIVLPEVNVDVRNDTLVICNTSGSTGMPKGVVHTHYSFTANLIMMEALKMRHSIMEFVINYGVVNVCLAMYSLKYGLTVYHLNKFDKNTYLSALLSFKPRSIVLYPYLAASFARDPILSDVRQQGFLKHVMIAGWVLDSTTAALLSKNLPDTHIQQVYGMSEILYATATEIQDSGEAAKVPTIKIEGQTFTCSGSILANMEAKILDSETKELKPPLEEGVLYVRTPGMMRGYFSSSNVTIKSDIDQDGWICTGDVAFFDTHGRIYLKERANFMYKYLSHIIAPSEIECLLQEHPAVMAAGVVGLPNPETSNVTKAYVVLKAGQHCTPEELCAFVANKMPVRKQLHAGAKIVEKLPANRGGKLDRRALKEMALKDM